MRYKCPECGAPLERHQLDFITSALVNAQGALQCTKCPFTDIFGWKEQTGELEEYLSSEQSVKKNES